MTSNTSSSSSGTAHWRVVVACGVLQLVIERREVVKIKTNVKAGGGEFTITKRPDVSSPVLF